MATQTLVVCGVGDESGEARIEADYDDTSDPSDWSLVRLRCVNGMSRSVFIDMRRGNGQSWLTVEVAAGLTRDQDAGGPVRRQSDVPFMLLRTGN